MYTHEKMSKIVMWQAYRLITSRLQKGQLTYSPCTKEELKTYSSMEAICISACVAFCVQFYFFYWNEIPEAHNSKKSCTYSQNAINVINAIDLFFKYYDRADNWEFFFYLTN